MIRKLPLARPLRLLRQPLDYGQYYHVTLDYDPAHRRLACTLSGPPGSTGRVERHLAPLLSVEVAGRAYRFPQETGKGPDQALVIEHVPLAEIAVTVTLHDAQGMAPFAVIACPLNSHDEEAQPVARGHRLTVFETRMLGNDVRYPRVPYDRGALKPPHLRTDLHTHTSAQISAEGLIDIALAHNIPYPTRLLKLLKISYPEDRLCIATRFFFPPADAGSAEPIPREEEAVSVCHLDEPGITRLRAALSIPPDRQMTFGELEHTVYRYRYPISKHPQAASELWMKVAREYRRHGVEYAEITGVSTSMLTPDFMLFLHEHMPQIEAATGVRLRFLAGMPRNLSADMLEREVEKLMLMGDSPYICGIDFMGFEDSKTGQMEPYIRTIAEWARAHDPQFTLRIHAGENRKNMDNVKESLRLAKAYRMRVRIGHAAHGLDAEAIALAGELAKDNLVMIEFNPDSNLALNNIDTAEEHSIVTCIKENIPFVICSDGGGLYRTDARQLAIVAAFTAALAGVPQERIAAVEQYEADHIAQEEARFARRMAALPADFAERISAGYAPLRLPAAAAAPDEKPGDDFAAHLAKQGIDMSSRGIAAATKGREPLLMLGATGRRYWNLIDEAQKRAIQQAIERLVSALDPHRTYFLIGRPKDAGITALLSRAVQAHNEGKAAHDRFALISATVQADQTAHSFTPGLTHVLPLTGPLFTVPYQLIKYVEKHKGHTLFIGGGTFCRDAILVARDRNASFGLMNGPQGASTDKAVTMAPHRVFSGADGMIAHLQAAKPEWFPLTADRLSRPQYG